MKFSSEDYEDLEWIINHRGFKHVLALIDETVDKIQQDVVTSPLTGSAQDAMLALFAKRNEAQGALSLRNSLKKKFIELKYAREGK